MSSKKSSSKQLERAGFTLLELLVVLAGLGVLSSLAITNVSKYIDYTREDQANSLLNSVASDCLQKLRREGNADSTIDENILSFEKLKTFGYEFSQDDSPEVLPKCESVSIAPSSQTSTSPIIGFTINDNPGNDYGKLTKIATDQGDKNASARWAGSNIKTNEQVKAWRKLNEDISSAKKSCLGKFNKWIANDNSGFKDSWNDQRTSGCSSSPPATPNAKYCTPNGCDKRVWALKGEICGYTPEAYDECVAREKGARCQAALKQIREDKITTQIADGDPVSDCDGDRYWFYQGEDTGSKDSWSSLMCTANKQKLINTTYSGPVNYCDISPIYFCGGKEILGDRNTAKAKFEKCLANDKEAQCTLALNSDAVKRPNGGPYTSPTPSEMTAPVGSDCNVKYWYCKGKIHRGQSEYDSDKNCEKNCNDLRPFSECDREPFYKVPACFAYSKCLGRF